MESIVTTSAGLFSNGAAWAFLGAGASIVLAGAGSVLGTYPAAAKGAGVISENPSLFGKVTPLVALPGSSVIYGFLIALFIFLKLGGEISQIVGFQLFTIGLTMGLAGLFTGWLQGKAAAAGVGALGKNEAAFTPAIVLAALLETAAIFALLVSILLLQKVG